VSIVSLAGSLFVQVDLVALPIDPSLGVHEGGRGSFSQIHVRVGLYFLPYPDWQAPNYPHERFRAFKDEEDKLMVQRFVQSAEVAYEEDLAQWTARREQETKPAPMSDRSYRMFMNGFVLLLVLFAVCATWSGMASSSVLVGVLVGGATFFVGLIALAVTFSGGGPSPRERIQEWENANPRPVSRISDKPD
jgi:hypothetical protein